MFKAIKNNKIIAINDKDYFPLMDIDFSEEDTEHTIDDYEQYDGEYVLKQNVPVEYRNEQIRQQRQSRFAVEADPLKLDYDEAVARCEEQAEEKKQVWLNKKNQIREELPYIEVESE